MTAIETDYGMTKSVAENDPGTTVTVVEIGTRLRKRTLPGVNMATKEESRLCLKNNILLRMSTTHLIMHLTTHLNGSVKAADPYHQTHGIDLHLPSSLICPARYPIIETEIPSPVSSPRRGEVLMHRWNNAMFTLFCVYI